MQLRLGTCSHGQQLCPDTRKTGCSKRPGGYLTPCQRRMLCHGML
uniref:Uncharacterized protein n=1 Tax=Arundo donax TaxID=35708 RepID=A0A0A9AXC2_ARUDO